MDQQSLAIIGGGPAGLITLKYALDALPDWRIACFDEQSEHLGAWGKTHPAFVSTSTKHVTQFACFAKYPANSFDRNDPYGAFFRGDEFGEYLGEFVRKFDLDRHIRKRCRVDCVTPLEIGVATSPWRVQHTDLETDEQVEEEYTHVIFCTGLADRVRRVESEVPQVEDLAELDCVQGKTIVVLGGGESAADAALRLAPTEQGNRVVLSLRSGIRVSPRIHPIRGVPSDYLRTRLMLAVDEDLRNWLGDLFVGFRIRYESILRALFPGSGEQAAKNDCQNLRKQWDLRLRAKSRGKLFNVFHNKSDDFLDAVASGQVEVVGPPSDSSWRRFHDYDASSEVVVDPDLLVGAIGFDSSITRLTRGAASLEDFYLGCVHQQCTTVHAVGYARPIIGSIPPLAEMQAKYVVGLLAEQFERPANIEELRTQEAEEMRERYPAIATARVYPVDMIPYCDRLATRMGLLAGKRGALWKGPMFWLTPATTLQYLDPADRPPTKRFLPLGLVFLLLVAKAIDVPFRWIRRMIKRRHTE